MVRCPDALTTDFWCKEGPHKDRKKCQLQSLYTFLTRNRYLAHNKKPFEYYLKSSHTTQCTVLELNYKKSLPIM